MPSITISDRAAEKGRELLSKQTGLAAPGLRVRVSGGGCSGLMYRMDFDGVRGDADEVFEKDGFRVYVDRKSLFFLNGSELDYEDALTGAGFKFRNPNAKGTCGCGESFHV
jgi:iron-sulfur cluster assembly protein